MASDSLPGIRYGVFFIAYKHLALVLLLVQTSAVILTMRFSLSKSDGPKYVKTTAVVMSELFKLVASVSLLAYELNMSPVKFILYLNDEIFVKWRQSILLGIPAGLYTLQNNLLFIALQNLDGATYQVTYQLKIFTTAMFSVTLLGRNLDKNKWFALLLLMSGVALVQMPSETDAASPVVDDNHNLFTGLVAVISACCTSGFAGVYFEKILKGTKQSVWLRNIQLALFSVLLGLIGMCVIADFPRHCPKAWYINDGDEVASRGFFYGYSHLVWTVVTLQGLGGLVIAAVIKYADNILKSFATSLSIIFTAYFSWQFLDDFKLSPHFFVGAFLVMCATFVYSGSIPIFSVAQHTKTVELPVFTPDTKVKAVP